MRAIAAQDVKEWILLEQRRLSFLLTMSEVSEEEEGEGDEEPGRNPRLSSSSFTLEDLGAILQAASKEYDEDNKKELLTIDDHCNKKESKKEEDTMVELAQVLASLQTVALLRSVRCLRNLLQLKSRELREQRCKCYIYCIFFSKRMTSILMLHNNVIQWHGGPS